MTAPNQQPPKVPVAIEGVEMLGQRVLLRIYGAEQKSAGGIVLPNTAQKRQNFAWVVRLGSNVKDILPQLNVGDTVTYPPHQLSSAAPTFEIPPQNGVQYHTINAKDIDAIIRSPNNA